MRRARSSSLVALAALAAPAAALAHPLGNFTQPLRRVELSGDRVYVHYVLDLAEIPTFQDGGDGAALPRLRGGSSRDAARAPRRRPPASRSTLVAHGVAFPAGRRRPATTLRFEARLRGRGAGGSAVALRDTELRRPDRLAGDRRPRRATAPASSRRRRPRRARATRCAPTRASLLAQPARRARRATAHVEPGHGAGRPAGRSTRSRRRRARRRRLRGADLARRPHASASILVSLLVALFWGAAHALTPGHGKAIVAGYLVGTRGTPRARVLLGGIVTVTHTIGVFALGLVTLALSEFIVPEQLYPWLNLVSALLVVGVGASVLVQPDPRRDARLPPRTHHAPRPRARPPPPPRPRPPPRTRATASGLRGLVGVGISGGLLPCPTALVVLLAAISLHRVGFGLLLIVAFSARPRRRRSPASASSRSAREAAFGRDALEGPLVRALPAVSALVILVARRRA